MDTCTEHSVFAEKLGKIEAGVENITERLKGTLTKIEDHIGDSSIWRHKVNTLEVQMGMINEEKKENQWRVGIIIGAIAALPGFVMMVLHIIK